MTFSHRWEITRRRFWLVKQLSLGRLPSTIIRFGEALGDDLLCSVICRELQIRGVKRIWMMSKHPALFEGNPDITRVVPIDDRYAWMANRISIPYYVPYYAKHDADNDIDTPPSRHILEMMCRMAGITGEITLRPYFHLNNREKSAGKVSDKQIIIHSSGLAAIHAMRNKEWYPERFQEVVDDFSNGYDIIQVGSATDPYLEGCQDLRGRTNVRETAALLSQSLAFVGQVGFLMHLARAVECPAVIIYGGRELPSQTGYGCNINVVSSPLCSPCWRWNRCDFHRKCMDDISAKQVISALSEILEKSKAPLVSERCVLTERFALSP